MTLETSYAAKVSSGDPGQQPLHLVSILVVEDNDDSRELLEYLLSRAGARVRVAMDGVEALELLDHDIPHIIVSDLSMPRLDGFGLLQRLTSLRRELPPVPAIAISAMTSPEDRRRAIEVGFRAHLPKPVDSDQLIQTIQSLLRDAVTAA